MSFSLYQRSIDLKVIGVSDTTNQEKMRKKHRTDKVEEGEEKSFPIISGEHNVIDWKNMGNHRGYRVGVFRTATHDQ